MQAPCPAVDAQHKVDWMSFLEIFCLTLFCFDYFFKPYRSFANISWFPILWFSRFCVCLCVYTCYSCFCFSSSSFLLCFTSVCLLSVVCFCLFFFFLKRERKKSYSCADRKVGRIWEEMRKFKLWAEYIVWKKITFNKNWKHQIFYIIK